jgi:transcriptional regulator with XRE-family HTH domain
MPFSPSKLIAAREAKGWSQSDLARVIWGLITSTRGYPVARNRDRISVYERGLSSPNGLHLKQLAAALGVAPADLLDGPAVGPSPTFLITQAPTEPGKARLQVDMVVPFTVAAAIGKKLGKPNGVANCS